MRSLDPEYQELVARVLPDLEWVDPWGHPHARAAERRRVRGARLQRRDRRRSGVGRRRDAPRLRPVASAARDPRPDPGDQRSVRPRHAAQRGAGDLRRARPGPAPASRSSSAARTVPGPSNPTSTSRSSAASCWTDGNLSVGAHVDVANASALDSQSSLPLSLAVGCGNGRLLGPAEAAARLRLGDPGSAWARRLRRGRPGRPSAAGGGRGRKGRLQPGLVARRQADRLPAQPRRGETRATSWSCRQRREAAQPHQEPGGCRLVARVVSGRTVDRVLLGSRRRSRHLDDEARRDRQAPADERRWAERVSRLEP